MNHPRPDWLNEGILFISVQEPLIFRLRRGTTSTATCLYVDAEEAYEKERSEEAVKTLAEAGCTMAIVNAHKAFGIEAEEEDIRSAVRYAELCHSYGLKVGVYIGETLAYETFFKEMPEARDWLAVRYDGKPVYWFSQTFRKFPCKNHPGWIAFQKRVTAMAIERIGADFLHYDNVYVWEEPNSCHCRVCRRKFRDFLASKYAPEMLKKRLGFSDVSMVMPPPFPAEGPRIPPEELAVISDPLQQEWIDFRCQSLSEMYAGLCGYARTLKSDIALECNPVTTTINQAFYRGVDIPRLVGHGHCFWVEDGNAARIEEGRLISNIRTYKIARTTGNSAFAHLATEGRDALLGVAESMAFNLDCVGHIGPVRGVKNHPAKPLFKFYRSNRKLYAETETRADAAILRSFSTLAWNSFSPHLSTLLVEQVLIQRRVPFHIIFDDGLDGLDKYKTLILADVLCMSDESLRKVSRFVENGGGLLVIGDTARFDDISRQRYESGFTGLLARDDIRERVRYIPKAVPKEPLPEHKPFWLTDNAYWHLPENDEEIYRAVLQCCGERLSLEADAGPQVAAELARRREPAGLIVHLVDYDTEETLDSVEVSVRLPSGSEADAVRRYDPFSGRSEPVPFEKAEDRIVFSVPDLNIYAVAEVDLVTITR